MCSETVGYPQIFLDSDSDIDNNTPIKYNINENLSIYIPYINREQADENYIKHIFNTLNIGIVNHVDLYECSHSSNYKMAFIYMKKWYDGLLVQHLQEKILDIKQEARLVYDDPQYWVLLPIKHPFPENYTERIDYLHKLLMETNRLTNIRINTLEEKNKARETEILHMQWWIKLQHTNILYLYSKLNNDELNNDELNNAKIYSALSDNTICENTTNKNNNTSIYSNNSCCGAISNGWIASRSSEIQVKEDNNWIRRLRPRF